jgi:hypothetical protein
VFRQKITDAERILATILHLQQLRADLHGRVRLEPGSAASASAVGAPATPAA